MSGDATTEAPAIERNARAGLPWERKDPGRTPAGALDTLRVVLFSPGDAFRQMHQVGGLGSPLLFLLIFGTLGAFFALAWGAAMRSIALVSSPAGFPFDPAGVAQANSLAVVQLLLAPFVMLFSAVVGAVVYHAMLMISGGAPHPFETTLRVVCFGTGAANLWQIAPFCGLFVAPVWGLVVTIIGLREAQQVPAARAAAAVLVPVLLVCCCFLLWFVAVGLAVGIPGLLDAAG